MNAMIFAAGLGTRLRPLTNDRPKALVEVNGKTLLEHNIERLKAAGCRQLVVNVHHFGQQIIDFLAAHNNFGIDIRVSDERQLLLDTGGGIRQALSLFTEAAPILIHNVDIISDIDLRSLYQSHLDHAAKDAGCGATLAINQRKTSRYLMFDDDRRLCGWTNISTGEVKGTVGEKFAFSGIHVVDPSLFPLLDEMPDGPFPIISFYLEACKRLNLYGHDVTENHWVDCGKPESLCRAAEILSIYC